MKNESTRRTFVKKSGAIGAMLAAAKAPTVFAEGSPGDRIVVGVVGLRRGGSHVNTYLNLKNVEVGYVCEVDETRLASTAKKVASFFLRMSKRFSMTPCTRLSDSPPCRLLRKRSKMAS